MKTKRQGVGRHAAPTGRPHQNWCLAVLAKQKLSAQVAVISCKPYGLSNNL
jgi:hypothetical protein